MEDYAYAQAAGEIGGLDLYGFFIDVDLSRIRLPEAVEDLDQSVFARSVFAKEGMNFPWAELEVRFVGG